AVAGATVGGAILAYQKVKDAIGGDDNEHTFDSFPLAEGNEYAENLFDVKTPEALIADVHDEIERSMDLFNIPEPQSYLSEEDDVNQISGVKIYATKDKLDDFELVQSEDVPTEHATTANFDEEIETPSRKSSKAEGQSRDTTLQHQDSASSFAAGLQNSPEGSEAERSSQSTIIRVPSLLSQAYEDLEKRDSDDEELVDSETPMTITHPVSETFDNLNDLTNEQLSEHQMRSISSSDVREEIHATETDHSHKLDVSHQPENAAQHRNQKNFEDENFDENNEKHLVYSEDLYEQEKRSPEDFKSREIENEDTSKYSPGVFEGASAELAKDDELEDELLQQRPLEISYPELVHENKKQHINENLVNSYGITANEEASHGTPEFMQSEESESYTGNYPKDKYEGEPEPDEMQKSNEIEEEPLSQRPHDIPYPGEEDEKSPGLATKIAGAVAGATVGGAILAYQKVKDAIGGDDNELELFPEEPIHDNESESYLTGESQKLRYERETPSPNGNIIKDESCESEQIKAYHEPNFDTPTKSTSSTVFQEITGGFIDTHRITVNESLLANEKDDNKRESLHLSQDVVAAEFLTGEPMTESQIADTPEEEVPSSDSHMRDYELIENENVSVADLMESPGKEKYETIIHPEMIQTDIFPESDSQNKFENITDSVKHIVKNIPKETDPMTQLIHPDHESPDNFELIESNDILLLEDDKISHHLTSTTSEHADNEGEWQTITEPELSEIPLHTDLSAPLLKQKPFDNELRVDNEQNQVGAIADSLTTSTHKIEEHAEELVRDVLEQIENENLMEMSMDSLNLHEEGRGIPRIAEDQRDTELEDMDMEDSLNTGEQALSSGTMLGVQQDIPAFRPSSPVPPAFGKVEDVEQEQVVDEQMDVDSLNGESGSSGEASVVDASKKKKHTSYDNVSESSLQEFERLEFELREHAGESPTSENAEYEKVVESQTGSISSLIEFENIEREVRENTLAQVATAEEVMMLSDIREESEIEEMSVREDDEEEDSLSESKPPQIGHDERQSHYPAETMLTSTDSLEAVTRQPLILETSTDSLELRQNYNYSPNQNEHDEFTAHQTDQDSLLEGVSQSNLSQETQMLSGDTVATYQEYQDEDDDDKDSLTDVIASYPTTLTTFETVQRKDDGSVETISRRVMTRVTDPVHSRVRFTGTEDERRLHSIPVDHPVETVDEEGNVTTTQCRRTPTN
uniref:Uncharacterized protein n=1 Tax=Panagrolaimus sp. ES5 TaxID=591445 RepID=A0AC34FF40_9BILA